MRIVAAPGVRGERMKLVCAVFDAEGKPVADALIETWQANADGKYNHPAEIGRCPPASADPDKSLTGKSATARVLLKCLVPSWWHSGRRW